MADESNSADENSNNEAKCRWPSYDNYRLIMWVWMMNETTIMFSPSELSHNGFYFHAVVQAIGVIFVGIPLVYSEIIVAQYTNCDVFTMWNYFPIFRYVGCGTVYLIVLKTIYIKVLTSWLLVYTFYSTFDPPPWFSCEGLNSTNCMVKSINVTIFQHCIESQIQYDEDCGIITASAWLFEREIGNKNTNGESCFFAWKPIIACFVISLLLILLSVRKQKYMQIVTKFLVGYIVIVVLILFCVTLSFKGAWRPSKIGFHWNLINLTNIFNSITRGLLSVGTGCGIIIFLSKDVSFRSPATMTAISTPLFSFILCLLFAATAFSGIKTMSYFHGEEDYVIEMHNSIFFSVFASISEIMTYFKLYIWGFLWFSSITFCLFSNLWIMHVYLGDLLFLSKVAHKYTCFATVFLMFFINLITWPFLCSDFTGALLDGTEIIQILNNILFSLSFYWIYGYNNHSIDIIFMMGVKTTYFWKITWFLNPVILLTILYFRILDLESRIYGGFVFLYLDIEVARLLLYVILGIYTIILIIGVIVQLVNYYRRGMLRSLFFPSNYWGPQDIVLYKSRKMFVPEIMTTEFLYRQVRIRGYNFQKKHISIQKKTHESVELLQEEMEWSPLTSN